MWMRFNRPQINTAMTESSGAGRVDDRIKYLRVGKDSVMPVSSVGIYIDPEVSFRPSSLSAPRSKFRHSSRPTVWSSHLTYVFVYQLPSVVHTCNSDASMKTHISRTAFSFAVVRQIRSIRRSVSHLQSLVVVLVLIHASITAMRRRPAWQANRLDRLQSAMNAAARLVCSARKCTEPRRGHEKRCL